MKTTINYIMIITILVITCFPIASYGAESDKDLFNNARLAYLDNQFDRALNQLDRLIELYPDSSYYPQVLFYKAKCYAKEKMLQKALDNFKECVVVSENGFLKEQANISIIDMNLSLYDKTDNKKYTGEIVRYLKSKNEALQYYAAIILSKIKDKTIASRAVPILKKIIALESDQELVDRAKIAIMRIDPGQLKQPSKSKNLGMLVFRIRVTDKKTQIETFSLSIPFALARLAMDSLPEDAKDALKEEGYNLDEIIDAIVKTGEILKIESKDSIFRIWVEEQ